MRFQFVRGRLNCASIERTNRRSCRQEGCRRRDQPRVASGRSSCEGRADSARARRARQLRHLPLQMLRTNDPSRGKRTRSRDGSWMSSCARSRYAVSRYVRDTGAPKPGLADTAREGIELAAIENRGVRSHRNIVRKTMSLAGQAVVAIWNGIAPEGRTEFYEWHNREHMPERVGIPGFRRGRRYIAKYGTPEFFTLYEADSAGSAGRAGLSQSAEQSDAADTARPAELLPRYLARRLPREALARRRAGRLHAHAALRRRGGARSRAGTVSAARRAAAADRHRGGRSACICASRIRRRATSRRPSEATARSKSRTGW